MNPLSQPTDYAIEDYDFIHTLNHSMGKDWNAVALTESPYSIVSSMNTPRVPDQFTNGHIDPDLGRAVVRELCYEFGDSI